MQISVRFRIRTPRKKNDGSHQNPKGKRTLYVRLAVNGIMARCDYSSGVKVEKDLWSQDLQTMTGRSKITQVTNDRLQAIEAEHKEILNRQISLGKIPTAESIKKEWLHGNTPLPFVVELYQKHLDFLDELEGTEEGKAERTMEKWYYGKQHLQNYILQEVGRKDIEISELNVSWGRHYHKWLMKQPIPGKKGKKKQNKDTAAKYVSFLKAALDFGIESSFLEINPLEKLRFTRSKPKAVYFLEDEHLKKFWNLKLDTTADLARDLALLICYTGMDFPDLEKFLDSPRSYIFTTLSGKKKIIIHRSKPPHGECQIPYLQPITTILSKYNWKVPRLHDHTINRFLQVFESQIGFLGGRVTIKILRKTAGALFLNEGYTLEVVQKILGHSSISTTERHYAKVRDKRVDREMDRVGVEFA